MDTLALGYVIPAIRAYSGLAPVRQCSCRAYNDKGLYATMKRWRIDPWLYGDIRNLHLRFLVHTFFHTVSYAIHLILYLVSLQNDAFFLKRPNKKRENWLIDIHIQDVLIFP